RWVTDFLRLISVSADLDPDRQRLTFHLADRREARIARARELDGDARVADAQPFQPDPLERLRQMRIHDLERLPRRVGINAETGAQHEEERSGGPGLRRARDGIADDQVSFPAPHAAVQLRKAIVAE